MRERNRIVTQEKCECFYRGCKREPLESSKDGYCIFHAGEEDKNEREFKEALKRYIEDIEKTRADYDFRGFVFVGDIDFKKRFEVTAFKNANFKRAKFQEYTSFRGAKFQENAVFAGAGFQGVVFFEEAEFQGNADFMREKFHGPAYFGKVKFQGVADFVRTEFQGDVKFMRTTFQGKVLFEETKFQGSVYFMAAHFQERASFAEATFQGATNFWGTQFQKDVSFFLAKFSPGAYLLVNFNKGKVSFEKTVLENVYATPLNLGRTVLIDFDGAKLSSVEIKRKDIEGHIIQEHRKNFRQAKEIYLVLKNNFHTIGRYDDESWAFKKEKEMERKSYFHGRPLKWLGSMFWNLLYGYGEKPFWIFGWCGFLLLFSSFIYWLSKGVFQVMGNRLVLVGDYWNNLYFSVVTFTTLGYGDFRPIGKIRVLASFEAFLGIFLIALFIFTFARKTGGR